MNSQSRVLRMKNLPSVTGLSRSLLYKYVKEGKFPASIRLGERAVGWHERDVEAWLTSRATNSPANG